MAFVTMDSADEKAIAGGGDSSMFGITLEQSKQLMQERDSNFIKKISREHNGVEGILAKLKVDKDKGLDSNDQQDLEQRRQAYGKNIIPQKPLHFFQSPSRWLKEHDVRRMQDEFEKDRHASVLRDHRIQGIRISELVVGDICLIHAGEIIPADGLIIEANDLKVDESFLTGESELETKNNNNNIAVLSGTEVKEGSGKILVVAVGLNSQMGTIANLLDLGKAKLQHNNPT